MPKKQDPRIGKLFKTQPEDIRDSIFRTIEFMGLRGFHAKTIASVCGISLYEVYASCKKMEIRLRDYRDGKGDPAQAIIVRAPVKKVQR